MSLVRVALVAVETIFTQLATTPPNKTPTKGRYNTEEIFVMRFAPLIFALQRPFIWACLLLDTLAVLAPHLPPNALTSLGLNIHARQRVTAPFIFGVTMTVAGSALRLTCFRTLGKLFTFDLAVCDGHKLVTSGPYGVLTRGGGLMESGLLRPGGAPVFAYWAAWWAWAIACATRRAAAEDEEMRRQFGKEWEDYAKRVRWWFVPGLV
ncbi:hypothetical protein EVG20_g9805 [Dentipellis fragilis]|uniref:Protein-S-isoprenylcysteine O-methyltransferase n=1 Tax=Dentipellis fragilis TaxID=205917 RepID=A0A4Y9XVP1_9AGAM|nr:hypothetical protein EVG20_g9805 [Dentipellis fragilis]